MESDEFIEISKRLVSDYTNSRLKREGLDLIDKDVVYVVWSTKVLKNNKALLSTPISDGMYYEITYNGNREEIYFDAYEKIDNIKHDLN